MTLENQLRVVESPIPLREGETDIYTLNTLPFGGSPSAVSCELVHWDGNSEVVEGTLTGSPSVAGDVITSPVVSGLTGVPGGKEYRLTFQFTAAGRVRRPYLVILCYP